MAAATPDVPASIAERARCINLVLMQARLYPPGHACRRALARAAWAIAASARPIDETEAA